MTETSSSVSSSSTSVTTTTILSDSSPEILTDSFDWGERSDSVRLLQSTLEVTVDGIYGPVTRRAHLGALAESGLPTDDVPTRPEPIATQPATSVDDVPVPILDLIRNLWPEDQVPRALAVARCESNYRLDAANPTSSARGVFQLLAPWTRDPGSGRTVWGWIYTEEGEKLSAAAGLGIAEDDARYGYGNLVVAHEIWRHSGWGPWTASESCWRRG